MSLMTSIHLTVRPKHIFHILHTERVKSISGLKDEYLILLSADYRCPDSVLVSFRAQARSDSTIWSLQTGWMRQFETEILRRKERVLFTAEICYRWDENAEKACLGYNREGCAC